MKLAGTIKKLPIFGINEGTHLAVITNLYVNRKSRKVEYLSVLNNAGDIFPGVISLADIKSIGKDFVIVQSENSIKRLYTNSDAFSALDECTSPNGLSVISLSGDSIGTISDFLFDESSGAVEKIILDNKQEIAKDSIITLSQQFIVVNAEKAPSGGSPDEPEEDEPEQNDASSLDESTLAYLKDKIVSSDVLSDDGAFIIRQGTVLSESIIIKAAEHDMLVQLTMAV